MGMTDFAVKEADTSSRKERVVNDLSIQVATVNGSGSQSANTVLLRAIFQMGIPVSGKNLNVAESQQHAAGGFAQ